MSHDSMAYLLYNIVYNIEAMSHGTFEFKLVKCFSTVFDKKKKTQSNNFRRIDNIFGSFSMARNACKVFS